MSGSREEKLEALSVEEVAEEREVYLRDGRKLVLGEDGSDQLVEIRSASGALEVRIRLTEEGPVLQMESARLQLKAAEAVEIESKRVAIKGSEQVEVKGGALALEAEQDLGVKADGDVKVVGRKIFLN